MVFGVGTTAMFHYLFRPYVGFFKQVYGQNEVF